MINLPTKIILNRGASKNLNLLTQFGNRTLIITGKNATKKFGILQKITKSLEEAKIKAIIFDKVIGEPTTESVDECVEFAKTQKIDFIIGLGGGSVIDTAKATALLINNDGKAEHYVEIDGNKKITKQGIPFVSIPTTAGTGAEITNNAVLKNKKTQVKRSIRSEFGYPKIAICDTEFLYSVPPNITAWLGIDALSHLIEGLLSKRSTPITDIIALTGIKLIRENLIPAYNGDKIAKENMMLVSILGGIIIINAGLAIPHGISGVMGGMLNIPHGLSNAILLEKCLEFNSDNEKIKEISKKFNIEPIQEIRNFIKKFNFNYTIQKPLPSTIKKIAKLCYSKNNPKPISEKEFEKIIKESFDQWQ